MRTATDELIEVRLKLCSDDSFLSFRAFAYLQAYKRDALTLAHGGLDKYEKEQLIEERKEALAAHLLNLLVPFVEDTSPAAGQGEQQVRPEST